MLSCFLEFGLFYSLDWLIPSLGVKRARSWEAGRPGWSALNHRCNTGLLFHGQRILLLNMANSHVQIIVFHFSLLYIVTRLTIENIFSFSRIQREKKISPAKFINLHR